MRIAIIVGFLLVTSVANSAEIEGVIDSVQGSQIKVSFQGALGATTVDLKVSPFAKIVINDIVVPLAEITGGVSAQISVDDSTKEVTQIIGKRQQSGLEIIAELDGEYPSLTADGLTIFWEKAETANPWIWTASRKDSKSYFTDAKKLFPGRHPSVSGDGLEIIFLGTNARNERQIFSATRTSNEQPFNRGKVISEFTKFNNPKCPFLTVDGLTICFRDTSQNSQIVVSTKRSSGAKWSQPLPLTVQGTEARLGGYLVWPCLVNDGLTLITTLDGSPSGSQVLVSQRSSTNEPFSIFEKLECQSLPVAIRCPRYVDATNELFFSGHPKFTPQIKFGVIKGFQLP